MSEMADDFAEEFVEWGELEVEDMPEEWTYGEGGYIRRFSDSIWGDITGPSGGREFMDITDAGREIWLVDRNAISPDTTWAWTLREGSIGNWVANGYVDSCIKAKKECQNAADDYLDRRADERKLRQKV